MSKYHTQSGKSGETLNGKFDILSRSVRRRLLTALDKKNPRDEDDLASDSIASDGDNLELLQQEMYHNHLPKLEAAGFINWDRDAGTTTRGPRFVEIEPLIKLMDNHQDELPDDWP